MKFFILCILKSSPKTYKISAFSQNCNSDATSLSSKTILVSPFTIVGGTYTITLHFAEFPFPLIISTYSFWLSSFPFCSIFRVSPTTDTVSIPFPLTIIFYSKFFPFKKNVNESKRKIINKINIYIFVLHFYKVKVWIFYIL